MRILLVEDDPAIRLLLEKALSPHHVVEVAENGRLALALTHQFDYDLLLLDIGIPEIDGLSVCNQLRAQGCQLPILLLTARDRASDRVLGLDAGADDYMVKPFHIPELLARIRALLRRGRTTASSVSIWGKLQLNSVAREICYGEQLLHLTPKEYGILELLLRHPQQIFSRAALIDRLWELAETPTESAISSHIKAIRQKLKAAGAKQDLIETIYGFGYRLRSLEAETPANPKEGLETNPKVAAAAVDGVMVELWERFKASFSDQLDLLEQMVGALQAGTLTTDLQQEAKQTVHKLVGSLGVYGFPHGSVLARQIEDLLHPGLLLEAAEIQQMAEWVTALRQEISQKPQTVTTAQPSLLPMAQVLVVDADTAWTERLQAEAPARSLHVTSVPHSRAAQPLLDRNQPDVLLLDLTVADRHAEGLSWLETLKQRYPQMPVLVFMQQDNLSDRVAAVRLGVRALLQKPVAVEQVFQAIQEALKPRQSTTARVLAVDDDPGILHRLSVVLSPWGLEVITLPDPARFWEVLTRTVPDLLLLDIEMPGFNGIELCQVVRHDAKWGNLPILFLTAHQEADMITQAFAAGGDDYIRKPILEPELVARVLNRLEGKRRRGGEGSA
jgi:DNA-binding response OmpR family regulator/HPt (histidine-containing phosphotransfer) domain-containing protein